jgi:hypothetical protein|tara:strand:- start:110 stop:397 length:288 start_codon:yes stop_codon:yes gene_type:complete
MITTHSVIRDLYPKVTFVSELEENKFTCRDKDGNSVTVDADAVVAEFKKQEYKNKRAVAYPSIQEQLDMQYWDKKNGTTTWVDAIAKVKSDNPKP